MALSDYNENLDDQELNQEDAELFADLTDDVSNTDTSIDEALFDPELEIIEDEEKKKKKKKQVTPQKSKNKKSFFNQRLEDLKVESFDKFAAKAAKKVKEEAPGEAMVNEFLNKPSQYNFSELGGYVTPESKRGILFAEEDAKNLKKEQDKLKKTAEEQAKLDVTQGYRTKRALEELSFDNPYKVDYDIDRESAVETTNNLNKKINRLGLEAQKFGDRVALRKIGEGIGVGPEQDGTFFEISDVSGMNKFISEFGDKEYYKKVKSLSKNKYPDLWEKITPPVLSDEEKKAQATSSLINEFEEVENSSTAAIASMGGLGQTKSLISQDSFENPEDYYIYKEWKKNPNAPLRLDDSRIDAWDKERKEKFIQRASTNYARNLSPNERRDLQIVVQEKINDSKYAEKALVKDIDNYKLKIDDFNKDVELYKKAPTQEGLNILKKRSLDLIDEQNNITNRESDLQKEINYTRGVLAPSLTAFSANYNRLSQLANATLSTVANVGMAINDIAAYGSSTVLGMKQEDVVKADATGLLHVSRELEKEKQQYQRSIGVDEISSMDDAGNWLMGATVNTLPSIGMAFTGSAALPLFFASGYGGKATQIMLDAEEATKRLSENTFALNNTTDGFERAQLQSQINADKALLELPEYKKFLGKAIYGGAEVGFEILGTLKILKGVGTAARMLPKKKIKDALIWAGKNSAKNFNIEGLSELGTTTVDNFVDKYIFGENKNLFEGGLESYTQGGVAGVSFGGLDAYKVVKRAVASELADKRQSRRMQEIVNQISELTGVEGYKKDQSTPLPMQSPPVQKLVEELTGESQEIENSIVNRVGVDLTIEQAKEIGDINRQINEVNKDFSEAVQDPNLSPSQLKTLETYYRGKFNELVNQRETLLTDPTIKENNIKANREARFEFDSTGGFEMYNTRMQRISLGKVLNDFKNLGGNTKNELLANAQTQLAAETGKNAEDITKKEIENKAFENYAEDHYTKAIKKGITNSEAFAKDKDVDITISQFEGDGANESIIEAYNKSEEAKMPGAKKEFAEGIKNGTIDAANVTIDGKSFALIHIKNAAKNGRTGVGSHELLHSAVKKAFIDQKGVDQAGKDLLEYLEKYDQDIYALVTARIDSSYSEKDKKGLRLRDENGDIIKDANYYEEAMNALSDISADGVELPKDSLNAIRNFINKLLPKGFPKFKEDQGAFVYEFVKNYNKEAHFGKKNKANLINFSGQIIGGDQEEKTRARFSVTKVAEVQKKIDKLEDQFDNDEIDFDDYESRLEELEKELEKAKAAPEEIKKEVKKEVSAEDEVKEIVKSESGSVSSNKVQQIYETKGLEGSQEIIDLFKPITKKIVDKRRDAPGFDRDLLTDEIETGDGGIIYLIRSYKPEKGVPLAAYINKQLPLRAIAASRRVLEGDFKKDVTEEKGLMAEETVSEAKEKPKYKNALESKVFEPEVLKTMSDKILTQLRTLKSRIDAPISLNRTVTPLIAEIRDAIGKQLDIDVKKAMGGKKDNELVNWLLKNKRYMLENMTTTWLMGANGQGGIPQAIQKRIDGKWVSYPDWVDQKIDRESVSTDNAGRTSGAELVRRLPNAFNNISDTDYLGQFIGPDGNPIRGRKESGAKAVAEESAFDIINKDLEEQGPIFEALTANQTRLGVEILENFPITFRKDAERGNSKYSVTYNNFSERQRNYIDKNINAFGFELANINYGVLPNKEDILKALRKVYGNGIIPDKDLNSLAVDITEYYTPKLAKAFKQYEEKFKGFDLGAWMKASLERNSNKLDILNSRTNENATRLFTDPIKIGEAHKYASNFISYLGENFSDEELNSMIRKIGTFSASQGQIGDDSFIIIDNKLERQKPRLRKNKEGIEIGAKKISYQLFSSKPSFWAFANMALGKEKTESFGRNRKGYIKDSAKDLFANKNNKEYLENQKATAKENQDFLFELLDWYNDPNNGVDKDTKAMLWSSLNTNQQTPLRKAAVAKWVFDPESGPKDFGTLIYEHLKSVDKTKWQLHEIFKNNQNLSKKERRKLFDEVMSDFHAGVIPVSMDKIVSSQGFQREGIAGDETEGSRYYNIATFAKDPMWHLNSLEDPNITLGEEFVKASNALVEANKNNDKIQAVTESLSKNSQTSKGISVFDFDDTVGITKSNVLYTMPGDLIVYHGAPKGKDVTKISNKGVKFFATDKREADEYARMHSGTTQQFVLNDSQIADEDIAINKMIELGLTPKNKDFTLDDASFYELIDTRFEESLSNADIEKLFNALKKDGIKALSYTDGAQVSGKLTTSIAVIDPSIISMPNKLNAEEFAKDGKALLDEGAVFDFSEFSKVTDGKPGPMVEKMKKMIGKFGPDNFFILTARPADSAIPIHQFLSSIGIDIPLENITGLGNSAAQAKADWIVQKANDGYNDFYFADDHLPNVNAVKNALDVLDIKSKIQQARAKFSKSMNYDFNKILEENTGTERFKIFSDIVARRRGVDKGKFDFYVPASAADFELLLYNFMGKGAKGEEHKKFFADALLKPYSNGNDLMDAARQSIKKNYKTLLDSFPDISKKLESLTPDGDFTYDQAIRVAIWNESDIEIPGISKRDITKLTKLVNDDAQLSAFKDGLIVTGRQGKGWVTPEEYWDVNTIISDLHNLTEGAGRKKFLGEFIDNVEEIFGTWDNGRLTGPNMNKVEALYGTRVREALEDVLYRMTTGKNKSFTKDRETTMWSNWVNGSTGAIMFLNTRSAALQLLGAINFLNFRDNNPVAAAMAFADQKQYWEDFARIWNSNKMKERRGGLKEDVAAAEIANAAAGSKNKANAVISYLLKIGYTPTQLADSFAIASGGAPFYRNRIKSYLKEGLPQEEAENKAWEDFTKVSDETQQSGDPRDISKQQASGAGRLLLTFQNFSMQQSRIVKKAILDLKNRRGDDKTNISKIIYYLSVQNILFSALQQGLFAVFFDDDDEDKKKKTNKEKAIGIADDVLDTILRGTGFVGGITVTLKNMIAKYVEESGKKQADYAEVVLEGASISPPIGSKLKKLYKGFEQTKYDKDLIKERGWSVMQDGRVHLGPMYGVTGKLVEATTNIPMDRIVNKIENVSQAMNSQNQAWQRVMIGMGWTPYSVGIKSTPGDLKIKEEAKAVRKVEGKIKSAETRRATRDSIENLSDDEYKKYVLKKKAEREARKDSINNLPPEERKKYLEAKEKAKELKAKEKEILKEAKADSIANLSPEEKAKYNKKVAEEKAAKKEERHQKYLEKKKALQDSLAGLSPRERERYKAKKKAERHQYYLEHKDEYAKRRKSKKKKKPSMLDAL